MALTGRQILEAHANRHDGGRRLIWSKLSDKERKDLLKAVRGEPEAYLSGANLGGAELGGADFSGANLGGANLSWANLSGSDLSGAYLSGSNLRGANLRGANLSGAVLPAAPKVEDLDGQILRLVESGKGELEMGKYHTCRTAHCRSGWAIHLAGKEGYSLEKRYGPSVAGALIYYASTGHVPDFYATNEAALADIRERAEAA